MIDAIVAVAAFPFAIFAVYLGLLGVLALFPRHHDRTATLRPMIFAVVVPAHDEEQLLPRLLKSVQAASSTHDLRLHVIADNCTDATASVARSNGANVWERTDPQRRSKGYALAWLLDQEDFRASPFDAVLLVDADCVVSPSFFDAMARALASPARSQVLQARYDILAPHRSSTLELRQFAFGLVHVVRARGKQMFGGSAGLKGTGMCFTRSALDTMGWRSFGLAEDAEQHIAVLRAGFKVGVVEDAVVSGDMPASLAAAASQHERWEAGRLSVIRLLPALVLDALRRRDIALADTALEQLVPPLAVLALTLAALAVAAVVSGLQAALAVSVAGLAGIVAYIVAGLAVLRPDPQSMVRAAAVAPMYLAWKVARYVRAALPLQARTWTRTSRDEVA